MTPRVIQTADERAAEVVEQKLNVVTPAEKSPLPYDKRPNRDFSKCGRAS